MSERSRRYETDTRAAAEGGADLRPLLESLLFAAGEPVPAARLAEALAADEAEVAAALEELRRHGCGGLEVARVAGGYQLVTRAEYAPLIARFLQPAPQKISRQALETLAIIAYRQPVSTPEIEALRGVDCGAVVHTLLERELIREAGRKDAPGRPILYRTTDEFLKYLGLADLTELPTLTEAANAQPPETQVA